MDWADVGAVGGLLAGTAGLSGAIGALLHRYYSRGKEDGGIAANNYQTTASIIRIEASMTELTKTFHQHVAEDAKNFGELKATVGACADGLKQAAEAMQNLTQRLDLAIGGNRHR